MAPPTGGTGNADDAKLLARVDERTENLMRVLGDLATRFEKALDENAKRYERIEERLRAVEPLAESKLADRIRKVEDTQIMTLAGVSAIVSAITIGWPLLRDLLHLGVTK